MLRAGAGGQTALSLNEDANHFFITRSDRRVREPDLTNWVDQYAGTQVRELILNVNAQRTAFASRVWTPFWKGYEPNGADDQPLFASLPPAQRAGTRAWIHTAWQMNQDGLDPFRIWTRRARQRGLLPWISIRMNDLHDVDNEQHPLHSDFWRQHPELRRIPYRSEMRDKALDFGHAAVREYTFALIEEVSHRYEFDGLELDWMRHGFHFAPGREAEGCAILTEFHRRVRRLLGSNRKLSVRVPPFPATSLRLGLDAVAWARERLVDYVVPTTFWRSVDTNLPVRLWRQLLPDTCLLGGGVELGLNPFVGSRTKEGQAFGKNSLLTVRGVAAAYLQQGADRVYLFNYMDSQTAIDNLADYPPLLRETGSLATLRGKPRRHILTYSDTWAPGEAPSLPLPVTMQAETWKAFRLATGLAERNMAATVVLGSRTNLADWTVRVNGAAARFTGPATAMAPAPDAALYGFAVDSSALRDGDTVIDLRAAGPGTIEWVELALVAE